MHLEAHFITCGGPLAVDLLVMGRTVHVETARHRSPKRAQPDHYSTRGWQL